MAKLTNLLAHRKDAEDAEFFINTFSLCALCAFAVNYIKTTGFLNFNPPRLAGTVTGPALIPKFYLLI